MICLSYTNWGQCFNENTINKINNTDDNLNFILKHLLDTDVQFICTNKQITKIKTNKIFLMKCDFFKYLYEHAKCDNLFKVRLDFNISEDALKLFFTLLHNINNIDKSNIYHHVTELHTLADYLINEEIKLYCENVISQHLNEYNFGALLEFCLCLDEEEGKYIVSYGRNRLFRFLIIWLKFFYNTTRSYTLTSLIHQFNETIIDFNKYDIVKNDITYSPPTTITVSLWTSFCNNCTIPILLTRFKGFIQSDKYTEVFDLLLIKDHVNINQYNIAIQRHIFKHIFTQQLDDEDEASYLDYIKEDNQIYSCIKSREISYDNFDEFISIKTNSTFQLSYCMVKLRKTSTLLIPSCIKTEPFNLRQNQMLTIGKITITEEDVYKSICKRCQDEGSNVAIGFKFNLFNHV